MKHAKYLALNYFPHSFSPKGVQTFAFCCIYLLTSDSGITQIWQAFQVWKNRYMEITTAQHAPEGPKQAEAVSRVLDKSIRMSHIIILKLPKGDYGHHRSQRQKDVLYGKTINLWLLTPHIQKSM